eukprot:9447987-Alexandrium_andersonii.AAC.1
MLKTGAPPGSGVGAGLALGHRKGLPRCKGFGGTETAPGTHSPARADETIGCTPMTALVIASARSSPNTGATPMH